MNRMIAAVLFASLVGVGLVAISLAGPSPVEPAEPPTPPGYVGSSKCIGCHERFYKLWSTSHHGLAMQPFTPEFVRTNLAPQSQAVVVGEYRYRAEIEGETAVVRETGPDGEKTYPMLHAMGGKNLYYFLTPMDRGKLQVLPVAFDVDTKNWYNATASMVRHFVDQDDEPVDWTDRLLTFNVSCYGCHVSQLETNYDYETNTYETVWTEPGINCETCHGPAEEHVRVCREAQGSDPPDDLKLVTINRKNGYSPHQVSTQCAPCHAKMYPLTDSFMPGDRYFDHYGLITLEHPDFYPDGRDLGENYTYTLWRMSPCVKSGQLDCMHCHTSSGRYRFADPAKANEACLPCHAERVANSAEHSRHEAGSEGDRCIACHMPTTEFARMKRSDHSMLPPAPAATMEFKSPNACNICHDDQDAAWADKYVREWRERDFQTPVLERARLIQSARKSDWSKLPAMLEYLQRDDREEIFATSLIRLLQTCGDENEWPAMIAMLDDPSPLVRSAAAASLEPYRTLEGRAALVKATGDDYRIVRVLAAAALAAFPVDGLTQEEVKQWEAASDEYKAMLKTRQDDWSSHYNMGNYMADRGQPDRALQSYETAMRLDPTQTPPYVNASMVYARQGKNGEAEALLRKALEADPESAEANFNLGLLTAETGDRKEAVALLRRALKADPNLAQAAYNLAVLVSEDDPNETIRLCRQATKVRPDNPRYAYTLAFYLHQQGHTDAAIEELRRITAQKPADADVYAMLAGLYEQQERWDRARRVYTDAASNPNLPPDVRRAFAERLRRLPQQ